MNKIKTLFLAWACAFGLWSCDNAPNKKQLKLRMEDKTVILLDVDVKEGDNYKPWDLVNIIKYQLFMDLNNNWKLDMWDRIRGKRIKINNKKRNVWDIFYVDELVKWKVEKTTPARIETISNNNK